MNNKLKLLTAIIITTIVVGCATAYLPIGATGGYYHQKVSENKYIIGFQGNGFTESQRADDYATLRAAEIGSKLGFTHFVIEGISDKSGTQIVDMGSTTTTSGNVFARGNNASFYSTSRTTSNSMPVFKPGIEISVFFFDGIPEGRHLEVFVIQDVINIIKTKYEITP